MSDDGAVEPEANVPTSENGDAAKDAADDTGVLQEAKTAVARQQRQLQLLAERFTATADAARGETASLRPQLKTLTRVIMEFMDRGIGVFSENPYDRRVSN